MKGLLEQAVPGGANQAAQAPSNPSATDQATQTGASMDQATFDEMEKKAIALVYQDEKKFAQMIELFKKGGPERFAKTMSTVVNGILDVIEKEHGELEDRVLAELGKGIIAAIAQDLMQGQMIQVDKQMLQDAGTVALQDWMTAHPERVDAQAVMEAQQPGAV